MQCLYIHTVASVFFYLNMHVLCKCVYVCVCIYVFLMYVASLPASLILDLFSFLMFF